MTTKPTTLNDLCLRLLFLFLLFLGSMMMFSTRVSAAPADDIVALQTACANGAAVLEQGMNMSTAMNTSTLVQNIGYEVSAAHMNLPLAGSIPAASSSASSPELLSPTTVSAAEDPASSAIAAQSAEQAAAPLDGFFYNYTGALNTLSYALLRRGQAPHEEPNMPVYVGIQGLANAVQSYALALSNQNEISTSAYEITLTVENNLVEAESAWAAPANGSARRSRKRQSPAQQQQ